MLKKIMVMSVLLSSIGVFAADNTDAMQVDSSPLQKARLVLPNPFSGLDLLVTRRKKQEPWQLITRVEDVQRFIGSWVVFTGTSSRSQLGNQNEQSFILSADGPIKVGYVSKCIYEWKSGSGQVLHRVLQPDIADFTYPLNDQHIKEHNNTLCIRPMTFGEAKLLQQALDNKKAACHISPIEMRMWALNK